MSFGDMNHDDPNYVIYDIETQNDRPDHQISGDIRDIAETIKDLVSGIDGEALHEELVNLAEEVQCLEDNSPYAFYAEGPKEIKMLKNRTAPNPGQIWIQNEDED